MIHNFEVRALQSGTQVRVVMSGQLPTPQQSVEVEGYYPGTIHPLIDPGFAFVQLRTVQSGGYSSPALRPWAETVTMTSPHATCRIILDGRTIAHVPILAAYVVAVQTGVPDGELYLFRADQPMLSIYSIVFGPESYEACKAYMDRQTQTPIAWDGNLPWARALVAGGPGPERPWPLGVSVLAAGGERPWPLATGGGGGGTERPWPLRGQLLSEGVCELASAATVAAVQTGEVLTISTEVWIPSDAWRPQLLRSMLTVEPPAFILTICRPGEDQPRKMRSVRHQQSFVIGVPRDVVRVATADGVQDVKVKQLRGDAPSILAVTSEPTPSRYATGRSTSMDFAAALNDALQLLDVSSPPSSTYSFVDVVAVSVESGGIIGQTSLNVTVQRRI